VLATVEPGARSRLVEDSQCCTTRFHTGFVHHIPAVQGRARQGKRMLGCPRRYHNCYKGRLVALVHVPTSASAGMHEDTMDDSGSVGTECKAFSSRTPETWINPVIPHALLFMLAAVYAMCLPGVIESRMCPAVRDDALSHHRTLSNDVHAVLFSGTDIASILRVS
jgi:hypothetical protein